MFYNLLPLLSHDAQIFNLFTYLSFRAGGAVMTALFLSLYAGPKIIAWLKVRQVNVNNIREDVPEGHLKKVGTPSMGGIIILLSLVITTLLWGDLSNGYIWVVLVVTLGCGGVGFSDDYLKMKNKSKGLPGRIKLVALGSIALIAIVLYLFITNGIYGQPNNINPDILPAHPETFSTSLAFPFTQYMLNLGWFFIPFAMVVILGSSNAVNLTDGLDGLAIAPVMIAAGTLGFIAYLVGNARYADYLLIHYIPGAGELTVFCAAIVGSGLGFLWFNAPPAAVFMGDVGSLALGGALGAVAMVIKHELVWVIIGGVFVLEALSVIIQVGSFKLTGKRVFAMAPLHHHFEKKGWAESTIVIRFWIIAFTLAMIGLVTLKLR